MSNRVFIYHHLGLGDHFHCNGVVRYLLEESYKNQEVKIFTKKKYAEMIRFMYKDLKNLEIIPVTNNEKNELNEVNSHIKPGDKLEKIGFEYFIKNKNKDKTIDMLFYEQFNIEYSQRFKLTFWKRDNNEENKLFYKLVKNENYIFVDDDAKRNFMIPEKYLAKNFQIIRNSSDYSIFDYGKIIENAKEIHVMESSIRCMLEYLNTDKTKLYLYKFKNDNRGSIPFYNKKDEMIGSSKKWQIINVNFDVNKSFLKKIFNF